jgi:serine/threonine-protein kinase
VVLEFVNGPSLAELIEHYGRVQPTAAVRIMNQLVDALATAHEAGVIHRDVKPANVMLTRNGTAKLADLGLAELRQCETVPGGSRAKSLRAGTVAYLAPELAGSDSLADERSDIYSLGATMYHALLGAPLFEGQSPWQVLAMHASATVPSLRNKAPEVSPRLENMIMQMLSKSPDDRPQSFAEIQSMMANGSWM